MWEGVSGFLGTCEVLLLVSGGKSAHLCVLKPERWQAVWCCGRRKLCGIPTRRLCCAWVLSTVREVIFPNIGKFTRSLSEIEFLKQAGCMFLADDQVGAFWLVMGAALADVGFAAPTCTSSMCDTSASAQCKKERGTPFVPRNLGS